MWGQGPGCQPITPGLDLLGQDAGGFAGIRSRRLEDPVQLAAGIHRDPATCHVRSRNSVERPHIDSHRPELDEPVDSGRATELIGGGRGRGRGRFNHWRGGDRGRDAGGWLRRPQPVCTGCQRWQRAACRTSAGT